MASYAQYYRRIFQAHEKGLKLVVGGTGLGKTRGAREAILTSPPTDPKSIYIANRKQLIEEMAAQLDRSTFVIVPRDLEAVQLTLRDQRAALYALLSERTFKLYVDSYNAYNPWKVDIAATRQACRDLEELSSRDPLYPRADGGDDGWPGAAGAGYLQSGLARCRRQTVEYLGLPGPD